MKRETVGEYELLAPLGCANSGFSKWGFASKRGTVYFIKEFLSPVLPKKDAPISPVMYNKKVKECQDWFKKKKEVYAAIERSNTGNIVVPRDFFLNGTKFYLVTDKIDTTKMSLPQISSLSSNQKEIIIKALIHSIEALSEGGVAHGDLKPDNILIKPTVNGFHTAKIIDFDGSFLESAPPVDDNEIQGDTVYLAPETFLKIAGEDVKLTTQIDVFALGIICHQYLCGSLPSFPSEYDYVYEAVLDDAKVVINRSIPAPFDEIIPLMLEKDPEERMTLRQVYTAISGGKILRHKTLKGTMSEKPDEKPPVKPDENTVRDKPVVSGGGLKISSNLKTK